MGNVRWEFKFWYLYVMFCVLLYFFFLGNIVYSIGGLWICICGVGVVFGGMFVFVICNFCFYLFLIL